MKEISKEHALSLFRYFNPGDRVMRKIKHSKGGEKYYEGIIMTMDHDSLEIYWDTINGNYCATISGQEFTLCGFDEVMKGNDTFSPIKHKKLYFTIERI